MKFFRYFLFNIALVFIPPNVNALVERLQDCPSQEIICCFNEDEPVPGAGLGVYGTCWNWLEVNCGVCPQDQEDFDSRCNAIYAYSKATVSQLCIPPHSPRKE